MKSVAPRLLAPAYLDFVRDHGCCLVGCQDRAAIPHHFGPRGVARKSDDYYTVPLCHRHHREIHAGRLACPYPDGWVGFFREQALKLLIEYIGGGGNQGLNSPRIR